MKKEKEDLLKSILAKTPRIIQYSDKAKRRFLERISSKDDKIKQLIVSYLSCQTIREQELFIDAIAQHDKDSFTNALQEIAAWSPINVLAEQGVGV
jgi:hypothetical protein